MSNRLIEEIEKTLATTTSSLSELTPADQHRILVERVADMSDSIIPASDLAERLDWSRRKRIPLKVKFGIDPTGPDIHLGHSVPLLNLRLFQKFGHTVQFVIGDFTALIGDPSGRLDGRVALTEGEVASNLKSYISQASRLIDFKSPTVQVHHNSTWMNRLSIKEWVNIIGRFSASELLQREDFRKRIANGHGFTIAEMEYALFMAYDSVQLRSDIELGGVDQFLNLHACRTMMKIAGLTPEVIMVYDLLVGTTGECDEAGRQVKMSKSKGNYVPISVSPSELYGRVMAIADPVMIPWFRNLTLIGADHLAQLSDALRRGLIHPKDAKKLLARTTVATFNNDDYRVAKAAEYEFEQRFETKNSKAITETHSATAGDGLSLLDILCASVNMSRTKVRELSRQGAVRCMQETPKPISESELFSESTLYRSRLIRVGRIMFVRVQ